MVLGQRPVRGPSSWPPRGRAWAASQSGHSVRGEVRSERLPVNRLLAALSGVLATLAGVAAGHLAAALLDPATSPVLAVGSQVIDLTPTPVKEWAISQFGTRDKPILIGSVLVGVVLLAAVAGLLARRRFAYGAAVFVLLVAVPAVIAVTRPTAGVSAVAPSLVALVVGLAALAWLVRAAAPAAVGGRVGAPAEDRVEDRPGEAGGPSRRGLLVAMGVVAGAAAVLGGAGRWVASYRTRAVAIDLPAAAKPLPPLPEGLEERFAGITPLQVANSDFYRVDTRLDVPIVDVEEWTLTIDGDVEEEVTFTLDDILAMDLVEKDITLTCVSNSVGGEFVGGARWLGVPLNELLDRAGVGTRADQILSTDVDGMTISTPLALATDGRDALLAVGMNGEQLPREHGFPARMVIPGLYGFISATKWVTRMTLTTYDAETAYWTDRDWATEAPIKPSSRIDTPRALAPLDVGEVVVGGVAWAQQNGGVGTVQVRIDGGPWQDAELGPDVGNDYWRQWFYRWDAASGQHRIASRVVDGDGGPQSPARANPFPEGSSGIQELIVTVG
ncbi:molybdopterin-dependent oxidoreductase [Nocardioides sp. zg-579]|uniref:Molybdopterin-dependent oxidoreductase n=1 Tax=Nocardioides marmotae TaxID=2663857 RepID=A0A6I3JF47_9ACTN|nr:molybdopterin-dependent oxidoreductase [Gordonia jinghuaiqii]MTB96695.1 molybdopterin-dependent oxidoreductase [Nocardioides marmotae]QKE03091.1 molybdopterin-dependent oxidoreductase [Nocardioides marmotae]